MTPQTTTQDDAISDLVVRLQAEQPIIASLRPQATAATLKAAIDRGLVHVKFTETRGGTELGVRLDPAASDFTGADFANGQGQITLVGTLVLDFIPVRFEGVIRLDTLQGAGSLQPTGPAQWDV